MGLTTFNQTLFILIILISDPKFNYLTPFNLRMIASVFFAALALATGAIASPIEAKVDAGLVYGAPAAGAAAQVGAQTQADAKLQAAAQTQVGAQLQAAALAHAGANTQFGSWG